MRLALWLRFVTLIASMGVGFGAILMFSLGVAKLAGGLGFIFQPENAGTTAVIATVMEATDAFHPARCFSISGTASLT